MVKVDLRSCILEFYIDARKVALVYVYTPFHPLACWYMLFDCSIVIDWSPDRVTGGRNDRACSCLDFRTIPSLPDYSSLFLSLCSLLQALNIVAETGDGSLESLETCVSL